MALLLPFACVLLVVLLLKRHFPSILWREGSLISLLAFGGLVWFSCELLSLFQLFSFYPLFIFWMLIFLALLILYIFKPSHQTLWEFPSASLLTPSEKFILKSVLLLAITLFLLAVYMPPNTWDAMTYHMSRVAHWIQNKSVGPYPTNIQRQLMINPFAEYWIAQFQILSGSDYWANSVQWFSMIGSLVGISLIAKALGLGRLGQILSAFFVITLPNAIVQSTSTQTDFVASLWCVIAVYFILKNIRKSQWDNSAAIAVAGGLALYTKGYTPFILLPFLGWMIWATLKTRRQIGMHVIFILFFWGGTCGTFFLKNYLIFGCPVLPGMENQLLPFNSLPLIFSNQLLHVVMHLKVGISQFDKILDNIMGNKFNFTDSPFYEDLVPNFLFMVFYLYWFFHLVIFKRKMLSSLKGKFFIVSFLCFFIFNCFVRWSPFDGRYHLPFFILFAPLLADVFAARRSMVPVAGLFLLAAVPFILFNCAKPIISKSSILTTPRDMRYFYNNPDLLGPVRTASSMILNSGCHEVGFEFREDAWEYPWWAYLQQRDKGIRIEHILVRNPSASLPYPLGTFSPCAIVSVQNSPNLNFQGRNYTAVGNFGVFSLYSL